jgi:exodeoxyribonuclease V alpha subunit
MALSYGISIITGGPGTGKSTLVSVICENLEMLDLRFILCSFTGAAVARLKEITGREAFTIHQLVNRIKKYKDYVQDHMIIIDEYSMVTTPLFSELLNVLRSDEFAWPKFLFVGDVDQLPPIEWGDLALQLTSIPQIPKTMLKTNMRVYQTLPGEKDGILNALEVLSNRSKEEREGTYKPPPTSQVNDDPGYEPDFDFDPDEMEFGAKKSGPFEETDNFFIYPGTIDDVYDIIIDVYKRGLHQDDITIISPYNACLPELNAKFEQIFHEDKRFVIDHWNNKWHIGSRIMCLENNYDLPIYNGTEAIVEDFNDDVLMIKVTETKIVNGKAVKMSKLHDIPLKARIKKPQTDPETGDPIDVEEFNTNKFMLSYAITTHKAQGNQWPYVVYYIPYGKGSGNFINRNQVYTAISRARRAVWIIGDIDAFYDSLGKGIPYRHNTLAVRARELLLGKK